MEGSVEVYCREIWVSELVKTTVRLPENDRVRRLVRSGAVSPLSPEREQAPFLLYLFGDSVSEIAFKQSIPKDIIEVTAAHYHWEEKRQAFAGSGLSLVSELQKKIANTLLVTAYMAMLKDLAEVSAGTKDGKDCLYIPKSIAGLQQLTEFVDKANGIIATDPNKPAQAAMPSVAVQVITGGSGDTVEVKRVDGEEKAKMLREMAAKKKV